jgi:hypothetical protein
MLPVMAGTMARRILINYRADPEVVARQIPPSLELNLVNGFAMVGLCLIRMERLRPNFLPFDFGMCSENIAHRVAVTYQENGERKPGVFIWRRETDSRLIAALGGRAFAGVHQRAEISIDEHGNEIQVQARTVDGKADVRLHAATTAEWNPTRLFPSFAMASDFLRAGCCGFSLGHDETSLEAMTLRTLSWKMTPLALRSLSSAFYEDEDRFPPGSIALDHALLMRGIALEWHAGTTAQHGYTHRDCALASAFGL